MKNLTWQEVAIVSGGCQSGNCTPEVKVPSWEESKLDQRQWSTIAGMAMQALVVHNMADGPARSAANIAGFAFVSVVCNTIFSVL